MPRAPALTVTLTGPESTGKTWLTGLLARRFDAPWSAEGARAYVDLLLARGEVPSLGADTVDPIARAQIALEDAAAAEAARRARPLVVRDTDLVSTVAYARLLYGAAPTWVERAAHERRATLYLLCDVDVPFVDDAARLDAVADREAARDAFVGTLRALDCAWTTVAGDWAARARAAEQAVERLLGGVAVTGSAGAP